MSSRLTRLGSAVALVGFGWLAAACSSGSSGSSATTPPPTTPTAPTTATTAPPTTPPTGTSTTTAPETTTTVPVTSTTPAAADRVVLSAAGDTMGPGWAEAFVVPYGDDTAALGVAPGGDNLLLGPDYGTQAADGSWWFLDAAKDRLAHYDLAGAYLGAVPMPVDLLVDGEYFQYQVPRVLDDGTLVATRGVSDSTTSVLRLRDGVIDAIDVPGGWFPSYDDGRLLYAFSPERELLAVDPDTGSVAPVEAFRTRAGTRFRLSVTPGSLRVELPDAGVDRTLPVLAPEEVGGTVGYSIEAVSTVDGALHLFVLGLSDAAESVQLAGYLTITPDGDVSPTEPVRDPFTPADPGSPAHLVVRPGTDEVSFVVVDTDGVHVYTRAG